ncbi:MAG: hypothetical protein WBF53_04110 [Litorimonas sp.]
MNGHTLWESASSSAQGEFDDLLSSADGPQTTDTGLFIASGLRAARGAQASRRRTILTDVASVLRCNPDELDFLFMDPVLAANDSDPVAMPEFRASFRTAAI